MNCDTCQALLVDLASGELNEDVREAAAAHAETCERCKSDLAVLREGLSLAAHLPILSPPPGVRAQLLERAREHIARSETAEHKARAARPAWWKRALSRFGELATSPQVAMATVLLLMIAVGLYYLPTGDSPAAELSPLGIEAESESETAPAATATAAPPAEPQDEEAEEEQTAEEAPNVDGQDSAEKRTARAAPRKQRARRRREAKKAPRGGTLRERSVRNRPSLAPLTRAPQKAKGRAKKSAFPGADDDEAEGASPGSGAPQAEMAAPAPAAPVSYLPEAQSAYDAGRYTEAAALAEKTLRTGAADPARAHWIAARSHRAQHDCEQALPHYTALRESPQRYPAALIQGALCLRALGRERAADQWLAQAEAIPAVRKRAASLRRPQTGAGAAAEPAN